jgi:hypothetical protein
MDAGLTRTISVGIPPKVDSGWLGRVCLLEHNPNGLNAVLLLLVTTGKETNESNVHEVGVDSRMLVRAVIGEDVNLDLLEATEPKHFAGAELGEATVADVVKVLQWLTASIKELDTSVVETRVDVDGECAFLVHNFSNFIADLLVEEHQVDKGIGGLVGMRRTAAVSAAYWIDRQVARWENVQPIDENLSAHLSG